MILVCGAGAIGSFIAYSLKKSDKEVELISRGKRLEEIKKHGLKGWALWACKLLYRIGCFRLFLWCYRGAVKCFHVDFKF